MASWELALVDAIAEEAARRGAVPLLPDRDWDSRDIPGRIKAQIEDADYFIGIATSSGPHLPWLEAEIEYCRGLERGRPFLLVADTDVRVNPSYEKVTIDRSDPLSTVSQVSRKIQELTGDEEAQDIIKGLLVGGLVLLFLDSVGKD